MVVPVGPDIKGTNRMTMIAATLAVIRPAAPAVAQRTNGPRIELRSGWGTQVATVTCSDASGTVTQSDAFSGVVYWGRGQL